MARGETVRAVVLTKPRTLEAREFPRPAIGADDALLRIEACGICGSDYEQYEGAQPQHEDYTPYPVIPGHEPLGIIEAADRSPPCRCGGSETAPLALPPGCGRGSLSAGPAGDGRMRPLALAPHTSTSCSSRSHIG